MVSGDSHRLHEELITAGGTISEGKLERWKVTQINEVLSHATMADAPDALRVRLQETWPRVAKPLMSALEARGRDRTESIQKQLNDRSEDEIRKITAVIQELENAIRRELTSEPNPQLSLFTDAEREQHKRDRDALAARVAELPSELEREIATIRRRYSNPTQRIFPVAVTFLVPEGLV